MDKILKISPRACESITDEVLEYEKDNVLKVLADLKARVERGELMSIAAAYHNYDGTVGTVFEAPVHKVTLLGAVQVLEDRLLDEIRSDW